MDNLEQSLKELSRNYQEMSVRGECFYRFALRFQYSLYNVCIIVILVKMITRNSFHILKEFLSSPQKEKEHFNLAREASFNNLTPVSKAHVESQPKRFADQMFLYYTILKVVNT